jgi:hypothetical protein
MRTCEMSDIPVRQRYSVFGYTSATAKSTHHPFKGWMNTTCNWRYFVDTFEDIELTHQEKCRVLDAAKEMYVDTGQYIHNEGARIVASAFIPGFGGAVYYAGLEPDYYLIGEPCPVGLHRETV